MISTVNIVEKTFYLIKFGERLRELRNRSGLTQEQLAEKAKVHRTYIGMIERGEKNVTLTNIYKLAKALGITINEFFV